MKETLRRTDKEITEIYHFGKSTTPDRPDQTWVNCLIFLLLDILFNNCS